MNFQPQAPDPPIVPAGYTLLRFPSTVQILRDGKRVAEIPVPYHPMSREEWGQAIIGAIKVSMKGGA